MLTDVTAVHLNILHIQHSPQCVACFAYTDV